MNNKTKKTSEELEYFSQILLGHKGGIQNYLLMNFTMFSAVIALKLVVKSLDNSGSNDEIKKQLFSIIDTWKQSQIRDFNACLSGHAYAVASPLGAMFERIFGESKDIKADFLTNLNEFTKRMKLVLEEIE